MKLATNFKYAVLAASLALAVPAFGQQRPVNLSSFGPAAGEREFTLSGTGVNDRDFDQVNGGVSGSMGWFTTDTTLWSVRQSLSFSDSDTGEAAWNGSTRGAVDFHFGSGPTRPFVGVNAGGLYGDNVSESFIAGLEGGFKFYVKPKTFVVLLAEYHWLFDDAGDVEDQFDDGQFVYSLGIGFNF